MQEERFILMKIALVFCTDLTMDPVSANVLERIKMNNALTKSTLSCDGN